MNELIEVHRFCCSGWNSVKAENIKAAATVFASRAARRVYGRRGEVRTCNIVASSQDGWRVECSAFIGKRSSGGETVGNNFTFIVTRG